MARHGTDSVNSILPLMSWAALGAFMSFRMWHWSVSLLTSVGKSSFYEFRIDSGVEKRNREQTHRKAGQ